MKYTGKELVEYMKENDMTSGVLTALRGNNTFNYFMLPIIGSLVTKDGTCDFVFIMSDGGIGRIEIIEPDINLINMASVEGAKYTAFYTVEQNEGPQLSFAKDGINNPDEVIARFFEKFGIDTHGRLKKLISDGYQIEENRLRASGQFSKRHVVKARRLSR